MEQRIKATRNQGISPAQAVVDRAVWDGRDRLAVRVLEEWPGQGRQRRGGQLLCSSARA